MPHVINNGATILGNLHDCCEVPHTDFASTFSDKLTSNTGKECKTLRVKVPHFIIKVLVSAKMIQTSRGGISYTATYLCQFQKGETYDYPSFMRKYINNYLRCHWKQPGKRKPKARTSRDSLSMTDSISNLTRSTNTINIQSKDSSSFDVSEAMKSFTNDSTKSQNVVPYEIDILNSDPCENLSIII